MAHNDHNKYNKDLQQVSNMLRSNMTKAEACLWKYALRARMMKGYMFRRQRPVLNFVADFMCQELMLVIEVDGLTHDFEDVQAKDDIKQKALEAAGFTIMRFSDTEVLTNMDGVYQFIYNWIEEKEHND